MRHIRHFVYGIVATGLLVSMIGVFAAARLDFSLLVPLWALLATLPYLVFARLATRFAGPETVVAGIMLVTAGGWAYIAAPDHAPGFAFTVLPLYLASLVMAVHVVGRGLRSAFSRSRRENVVDIDAGE